ncbi:response regulator transcription factor [Apibacter adventoris]|uniref:DNA-binding response regulator n=1 Tax=Apibacter adventoris TaxID=1679466 RepID=A0A2S8A7B1_9FLAO|nr:response regulator transcription factor [Apibacter adventoris]PQL90467.1 DNA-binding response regulator [Apibacter adventoris]
MELLLVEDNKKISEFMIKGLEESGFSVTLAENGVDARSQINERNWKVILLDIMLPDIDGIEILQYIRYKKIKTPILVISALGDPDDKVKALNYGADDYLSKPFHFKELIARIYALDRRMNMSYENSSDILICGDLKLYVDEHKIMRKGREIILTIQEFKLLKFLMENKNKVVSRTQILNSVWGINHDINTNIVDVYISYLRNKIDIDGENKMIETIKGRGYRIKS